MVAKGFRVVARPVRDILGSCQSVLSGSSGVAMWLLDFEWLPVHLYAVAKMF